MSNISQIAQQGLAIQNVLAAWAAELGGIVIVASNIFNMWEQATVKSETPRAIIAFEGEDIRGPVGTSALLGRVDRSWVVAIMRGQGTSVNRGEQLTNNIGNAKPFYEILEVARDVLRTMRLEPVQAWPSGAYTEEPIDYKGIKPMLMTNGQILDGNTIHFTIGTQIPQITGTMTPG